MDAGVKEFPCSINSFSVHKDCKNNNSNGVPGSLSLFPSTSHKVIGLNSWKWYMALYCSNYLTTFSGHILLCTAWNNKFFPQTFSTLEQIPDDDEQTSLGIIWQSPIRVLSLESLLPFRSLSLPIHNFSLLPIFFLWNLCLHSGFFPRYLCPLTKAFSWLICLFSQTSYSMFCVLWT